MQLNEENPVMKLCIEGIHAEGKGEATKAKLLYIEAWQMATSPFEKLVSAHYLARQQDTLEETLYWNMESLRQATFTEETSVKLFLPSLYLNVGKSLEDLGRKEEAASYYRLGQQFSNHLSQDGYGSMILKGIQAGLHRVTHS